MRSLQALTLTALLVLPSLARAADLSVEYTAREKDLKAAIAGTPLTFALYSDAACTTLVQSTIVAVENVELITKLKQFTPKNDTKLPNTVELHTVLGGVTPGGPRYLTVTGTGVVAVGSACQVQAAAGLGNGPGANLLVKDSNGATFGLYDAGPSGNTIRSVGGRQAFVVAQLPGIAQGAFDFLFTSANCTGTALTYVDAYSLVTNATLVGTTLYTFPATGASTTYNSRLHREALVTSQTECNLYFGGAPFVAPDGCCIPESFTLPLGPALSDDVSAFVPPLHIE